jgi:Methylase involved in ubiquinone/menaquinone biosynthesis
VDKGVRRAFDRARDTYREAARVQAEVAVECARLAGDGPLGRVLEIGAGCGLLTELLAPRTAGPYVALDLSPAMLGALPVPGVLRLAADGEAPPLRPGSFDFLASASAMQWFVRPEVALPACLDLLRPGGGFVLALFTEGTLAEPAWAARVSRFRTHSGPCVRPGPTNPCWRPCPACASRPRCGSTPCISPRRARPCAPCAAAALASAAAAPGRTRDAIGPFCRPTRNATAESAACR